MACWRWVQSRLCCRGRECAHITQRRGRPLCNVGSNVVADSGGVVADDETCSATSETVLHTRDSLRIVNGRERQAGVQRTPARNNPSAFHARSHSDWPACTWSLLSISRNSRHRSTMFASPVCRWANPVAASSPRTLHASKFVAYASRLDHPDRVPCVVGHISASPALKRASHLIYAYRTALGAGGHDGGEYGAGARLERLLELRGEQNVLVLVARWYGGVKLGSDRWRCISDVAKQALDQLEPPRI